MKGPPTKVVWYLPIIPRLKCLFANADDAKDLAWHENGRNCNGMLHHLANSFPWKKIDHLYPNFGKEPRNLRLRLATDGMNPYGSLGTQHSLWPVLLVIYNFPTWLCMKQKYMMLSMMISDPRQPEMTSMFIWVLWLKTWQSCGTWGLLCLMGIEMRHSRCMQCYFVPLMTFQHTGIWVDTMLMVVM